MVPEITKVVVAETIKKDGSGEDGQDNTPIESQTTVSAADMKKMNARIDALETSHNEMAGLMTVAVDRTCKILEKILEKI